MTRRVIRIGVAVSALVLSLIATVAPGTPLRSLGRWGTDHCAHYGAAIMFWHQGLRVFDTPMRELCSERTSDGIVFEFETGLPDNYICETPGVRPMVMNWQAYPRPYPPGALLYAAPEALLYAHTSLSLAAVDRIAIVKDLLAAHLLVLVLLELLAARALVLLPLVYAGVVPWAAAGIYDPIAVLFVCWAIARLDAEQPLDALACLCGAAFLHFRAIWYVPLGIVALARLRAAPSVLRTRRGVVLAAIAVVALAGALIALRLVGPSLATFPRTNPALLTRPSLATLGYVALALAVCGALAQQRQWLLVALVAWQAVLIGLTRQAQFWHPMFLLPLLVLARRARWPVVIAVVAWIVGVAICDGTPAMVVRFVHDVVTLNV